MRLRKAVRNHAMGILITRSGGGCQLETTQRIEHPLKDESPFFVDASNLEAITPPSLRFRILSTSPVVMRTGALIDYRLRINGVPVGRQSESDWDPPHRFVDQQRRGHDKWWVPEHRFHADDKLSSAFARRMCGLDGLLSLLFRHATAL